MFTEQLLPHSKLPPGVRQAHGEAHKILFATQMAIVIPETMLKLFYAPRLSGVWSVDIGQHGCSVFKSRVDALRFAIVAALESVQEGRSALVAVEGIDGFGACSTTRRKRLCKASPGVSLAYAAGDTLEHRPTLL
jgi:hypothetical protein